MDLKTCSQNAEIKLSKVQTHNFDANFSKPAKRVLEQSSSRSKATHRWNEIVVGGIVVIYTGQWESLTQREDER